jgi:hypothetical protein
LSDDLSKLLRESFEYNMTNIHTVLPGVIEKYDPKTRRADILPSFKRKLPNGEFAAFPIIPNVPVRHPSTKQYTIHFPLEKGEEVAIHFIERSTNVWRETGGGEIEDADPRRFNLMDCYAEIGLQPVEFIPVEEAGLNIVHKTAHDGDFISSVTLDDGKVQVKYKERASVLIEDDHVKAKTEKCFVDMGGSKLDVQNGLDKITADNGNVTVEAGTKATIKAPSVEITGGQFSMKGTVAPSTGPLCAIPNCLFTGAPHGGNMATGT